MSWVKNGLLLATGGIIGLCVAAALEADDDDSERSDGLRDVDGIAVLGEKLRREAEWAMEECTSDDERAAVYAELKASIGALQEKLAARGSYFRLTPRRLHISMKASGRSFSMLTLLPIRTQPSLHDCISIRTAGRGGYIPFIVCGRLPRGRFPLGAGATGLT